MKDTIRVAIIQPKPYPTFDDPRNLGHALMLLEKCRGESLDVVCFPEYFPYQGEKELGTAARQLNAYLVAGLVEAEGDRLYNTATLSIVPVASLDDSASATWGFWSGNSWGCHRETGCFARLRPILAKSASPCASISGVNRKQEGSSRIKGSISLLTSPSFLFFVGTGSRGPWCGRLTILCR